MGDCLSASFLFHSNLLLQLCFDMQTFFVALADDSKIGSLPIETLVIDEMDLSAMRVALELIGEGAGCWGQLLLNTDLIVRDEQGEVLADLEDGKLATCVFPKASSRMERLKPGTDCECCGFEAICERCFPTSAH